MNWQPIETAPKDELILVARTKRMCGPCAAMNHSQDGWVTETPGEWVSIYTPSHWMPLPAAPTLGADEWYLQDTRSYVGNDVVWWAKDGKGYTTDVSKAHVFTREEAFSQAAMRGVDRAWPKAYIDGKTRPAVDMQYINHDQAIAALSAKESP